MTMEKLLNTEEEGDVPSIFYINKTNEISMHDDKNFIHKYYAPFFCQIIMNIYFLDHNMIQGNGYYFVIKKIFWFCY